MRRNSLLVLLQGKTQNASPVIESQLLECLVAPPGTVNSPIHGGAVTLTKDRAIVPPATQSAQRDPKAW